MSIPREPRQLRLTAALIVLVGFCSILLPISPARADEIVPQVPVIGAEVGNPTLAWPRWKGYQSFSDPDRFWISYANGGSSVPNISFTTDGGENWTSNMQIGFDGWVDNHLSLFGYNDALNFTWPGSDGIQFRRFAPPAFSENDRGPLVDLSGTTGQYRSNVMVDDNGRIWVFTRLSGSQSQNVRYQYSDNNGANWTTGMAFATNHENIRFGSMPYVDGRPALVVLYLDDPRGYEYYLWNGSEFEAMPDHSIFGQDVGAVRAFTHNVVNDTVFHLLFGLDNGLHHVWKNFNNGQGSWNHSIIETSNTTTDVEWRPITTVRDNELFVFYCEWSTSSASSSQIYYKKWSQANQTWTDPLRVSDPAVSSGNTDPNTCFQVPPESDYIPVFWAGNGSEIFFGKVLVDPGTGSDVTPPATTNSLSAGPGSFDGDIDLAWIAPGDDGMSGTATTYVFKYHASPITSANWTAASTYPSPPFPTSGGQEQRFTMVGLTPGQRYYVAMRTYDERNNVSGISNSPASFAGGIKTPNPAEAAYDSTGNFIDLTCDTVTSYYQGLTYQFALDSTLSFPQPDLKHGSPDGGQVTVTYSDVEPATTYFWRCRAIAADQSDTSAWSSAGQISTGSCCEGTTGNLNCDSQEMVNLTDLTLLVNILFVTFETPCCFEEADINQDTNLSLTDLTQLVNYLFVTFEPLPACQ